MVTSRIQNYLFIQMTKNDPSLLLAESDDHENFFVLTP